MFFLMSAINRLLFTYSLTHSHIIITLTGKSFPIHLLLSACIFCRTVSFLSWLRLGTFSSGAGALGVWLKPLQRMHCMPSERWHQFCCREPLQCLSLCYEAQVLRIISHVNGRRKLRTLSLTLINPVANPNIHKLNTATFRSAQTFQLQLVWFSTEIKKN